MTRARLALTILALGAPAFAAAAQAPLSAYVVERSTGDFLTANSEQRMPVFLGASLFEMAQGDPLQDEPVLPAALLDLGAAQARRVRAALKADRVELEAWPAQDDEGQRTWAFARWRPNAAAAWRWLDDSLPLPAPGGEPPPFLPRVLSPAVPAQRSAIFDDFRTLPDLYAKPALGDCVWTSAGGENILDAWRPPSAAAFAPPEGALCRVLPQPARSNFNPISFVIAVDSVAVSWPPLRRVEEPSYDPSPLTSTAAVLSWPPDFDRTYREDVRALAAFERKNSSQPDNRLGDVVHYLETRYAKLGLRTRRQSFDWRGIPQSNLIAMIPGTLPDAGARPVIVADHIDTAFSEDVFKKTGKRVSAPGADDNATATAALLQAAEVLRGARLGRDVWLLHLTGEEFPGDDLGARHFLADALNSAQDVSGIIVLDMIGYSRHGDPVFQISAGEPAGSAALARLALGAAARTATALRGALRARFDERSYLYNTDGLIFSDAGIPVVLINEHLNKLENLNRRAYHESTDVLSRVDWDYAEALAKTAIETAALAASAAPPPRLPARLLPLPLVRQKTDYSCGAAAMLSVLKYWRAFDGGEKDLYAVLDTTPAEGTEPQGLADGARSFGLKADWRENLRFADLRSALERGDTPILALQAWPDPGAKIASWRDDWDDGHYVALIGMDADYAYFMDPSSDGKYAFLALPELADRWHDAETRHGLTWRYDHLAVFIHGDGPPASAAPRAALQRLP